ncbi:MAG TPA: S8 family serine peptidase, partial [Herpetosiphonaceae bacterium]
VSSLLSRPAAPAQAAGPTIDPALASALRAARPTDVLRVVATFDQPLGALQGRNLLGLVTKGQLLSRLPMALLVATPAQLSLVRALPGLRSLYLDKQLQYFLHESVALIGADRVRTDLGFDGSGVTVAVIDSGVDGTHRDLPYGSKVKQNVKLVGTGDLLPGLPTAGLVVPLENLPTSETSSGHGTHCAGVIAGSGAASGGYYAGVAPGAQLVGVGAGDAIFIFTALAGFDWVLAHQQELGVRVISNSWGTTGAFDAADPVNVASKQAHDAGIVVVFVAGNEGPANDTLNPYSVAPWVIGVAAGNKDGATLADFSSRGRPGDALYHPTITAPGAGIVSTRALNSILPVLGLPDDAQLNPAWIPYYTTMSGTSMATPHIAGVVALMLDANGALSPDQVKQILESTATPMPGYSRHEAGAGYVNAFAATQAALATP